MVKPRLNLKLFIIIVLIILKSNLLQAQKLFLTPEETFQEAKEYLFSEEPEEALPLFLELIDRGYNTSTVNYNIGKCFLQINGKKEKAVSYLEKAAKNVSRNYIGMGPDEDLAPLSILFLLGEAYRISEDLDKSIYFFTTYSDSLNNDTIEKNLVQLRIRQCKNAKELMMAKIELKATKLNDIVNNGTSNSNPVLTSDEKHLYYMKKLKFYDALMHTEKSAEGLTEPENLTPEIKSDGDFYVTGISADGNTLFLYAYDNYTKGDIYSIKFNGKNWSPIKKLNDNINTVYNESSAGISANGRTLFFTSSRKGGFGGLDIYKSNLNDKEEWGPAENLGPVINTIFNEDFPFVSAKNNILYFSSQGHYNMGGYDIFYSQLSDNNEWQYPLNIGYPLNTTDDDNFYFPIDDGRTGYHTKLSDSVSGIMDIFRYELKSYANPARYLIKGKVDIPGDSQIEKDQITVSFLEKQNQKQIGQENIDNEGNYSHKLPSGNFVLDFATSSQHLDKKELYIPEYMDLDEIILESKLDFKIILTAIDTFISNDILFTFDKFSITKSDFSFLTSLSQIMQKYNSVNLKLNGYTDSKGSETYNLQLSLKRVDEIKNFLVNSGISDERIQAEGFGEKSPVAINTNPDGTDNPEGRKYNRRVEILILNSPENLFIERKQQIPLQLKMKE